MLSPAAKGSADRTAPSFAQSEAGLRARLAVAMTYIASLMEPMHANALKGQFGYMAERLAMEDTRAIITAGLAPTISFLEFVSPVGDGSFKSSPALVKAKNDCKPLVRAVIRTVIQLEDADREAATSRQLMKPRLPTGSANPSHRTPSRPIVGAGHTGRIPDALSTGSDGDKDSVADGLALTDGIPSSQLSGASSQHGVASSSTASRPDHRDGGAPVVLSSADPALAIAQGPSASSLQAPVVASASSGPASTAALREELFIPLHASAMSNELRTAIGRKLDAATLTTGELLPTGWASALARFELIRLKWEALRSCGADDFAPWMSWHAAAAVLVHRRLPRGFNDSVHGSAAAPERRPAHKPAVTGTPAATLTADILADVRAELRAAAVRASAQDERLARQELLDTAMVANAKRLADAAEAVAVQQQRSASRRQGAAMELLKAACSRQWASVPRYARILVALSDGQQSAALDALMIIVDFAQARPELLAPCLRSLSVARDSEWLLELLTGDLSEDLMGHFDALAPASLE